MIDWKKHDYALQPITVELLRSLTALQRSECLNCYHEWLEQQRKQDRKEMKQKVNKIYRFVNADKLKEYRDTHKEEKREYMRKYRKMIKIKNEN